VHYGQAEAAYTKNENLGHKIDEAHLCMAESYYLQQQFTNAISETEYCVQTKDKADFMKVKYLSATNDKTNKQEAANILLRLIDKNPYITLQVLEDDDIVNNVFIIDLIEKIRVKKNNEARSIFNEIRQEDTKNIKQIEALILKNTLLDAYESIELAEEVFNIMAKKIDDAKKSLEKLKQEIRNKNRIEKEIKTIEDLITRKNSCDAMQAISMMDKILRPLFDVINYCNNKRGSINILLGLLKEAPVCVIEELMIRDIKFTKEVDEIELVDTYDGLYADFDVYIYERRTVTRIVHYKLNDLIKNIIQSGNKFG